MLAKRSRPREPRTLSDGRLVCRSAEDWEKQRSLCCDRAQGLCECGCGREAPLHHRKDERGLVLVWAGEAHHLTKRKVRDDRVSNLKWLARECHREMEDGFKIRSQKCL